MLELNIVGSTENCGPGCPAFIAKWKAWCYNRNNTHLALAHISNFYYRDLDRKSRAMIREAKDKGYEYGTFSYNDHLQDIYEINTSKEIRQGRPMSDAYLEYPTEISVDPSRCHLHQYLRIGGFKDNKLMAYCAVAVMNEIAILNTIIGHAEALPDGVMNGLIEAIIHILWDGSSAAKYLNYLTMESATEGLESFKRSVGFSSRQVAFIQ